MGAKRERREGSIRAPSSSASAGGIRVARTAGPMAASSVTRCRRRARRRRAGRQREVGGRDTRPAAWKRAPIAREPRPPSSPAGRRSRRSRGPRRHRAQHLPRVAPSVRSEANSRVRSATEIEKVLKMMKAPTRSAAPGEGEQRRAEEGVDRAGDRPWPVSSAFSWPVWTLTRAARSLWMRLDQASGETPGRGGNRDLVDLALLLVPALDVGRGRHREAVAGRGTRAAEVDQAHDGHVWVPRDVSRPIRSPTSIPCLVGEIAG